MPTTRDAKGFPMIENSTPETPASASSDNAPTAFTPLLTTRNWNGEWKELQKARRRADDSSYWDKRASTFTSKDSPTPYVQRFLDLAGIRPGETVFDMGCGTGALSLPLGKRGHKVVAADFSQGMLERMGEALARNGVTGVEPVRMSWEDDWAAHGVEPGSADVCVASRSIATADLEDSLMRLDAVARRRVCITLPTGSSPRIDERILSAIGLQRSLGRDYLYAFMILANRGIRPEVAYITSARTDTYDSFDEAYQELARMVDSASGTMVPEAEREAALGRLRTWLDDNRTENPDAGKADQDDQPQKRLRLREPRVVTWAFIAWDK